MLELLYAGGWLMIPIIACSIIATIIVIERFLALRRSQVVPDGVVDQVTEWSEKHELDRRHIRRLQTESPLGRVLAAALITRHRPREVIKEAVEDTGRHVIHSLERYLNTLGTIAGVAPLLGLLGTVIGMIKVFSAIVTYGVGDANALAGGISQALITTAAGLTVAIPSYFFYRYFRGRVAALVVEMEARAIHVIEAIERGNVAQHRSNLPWG